MTDWERRIQYLANFLVGGTGIVYAWMRYFMVPADEWAVVNHPWQPHLQHLHVITAPLLVFACGLIWYRHVANNWGREKRRRFSGSGLAVSFVPMIASGYLIQTTVTAPWRKTWIVVHLLTSLAWSVVLIAHLMLPARLRERGGADQRTS